MKTIKPLLLGLFAGILLFFACYLFGSFAQASFNISQWSGEARILIALIGGLISIVVSGIVIGILSVVSNDKV